MGSSAGKGRGGGAGEAWQWTLQAGSSHQPEHHPSALKASGLKASDERFSPGKLALFLSVAGDHLTHHHGRHGREQGDAERRQGALALGHRQGGDHAGPEAGHGELGGEFAAGAGAGARGHGGFFTIDRQTLRAMKRSSPSPRASCTRRGCSS